MIVDFDLLFPMVLSTTKFDVRTLNGEFITSTDLAVEDRDRIFSHSVGFFPLTLTLTRFGFKTRPTAKLGQSTLNHQKDSKGSKKSVWRKHRK